MGGTWIVASDLVGAQDLDAITDLAANTIAAAGRSRYGGHRGIHGRRPAAYAPELIDEGDIVQYLCCSRKKNFET